MILYEADPTWAGRATVKRYVDTIAVVSIDTTLKVNPLIWSVERLPYDCERLLVVPEPLGGALVLSINALFYVNQTTRIAIKLNELATIDEARFATTMLANDSMALNGARGAFVAPSTALLSLHDGALVVAHLLAASRVVRSFAVRRQGRAAPSLVVSLASKRFVFLGSR